MHYKFIFLSILCCSFYLLSTAQTSLQLNLGSNQISSKDFSASSSRYSGLGLKYGLAVQHQTKKQTLHFWEGNYRGGSISNLQNGTPMFIHYGNLSYGFLYPLNENANFRLGGKTDLFARYREIYRGGNNSLSYDMGWNVGVVADYSTSQIFGQWDLNVRLSLPLAVYYVRPVYGFPFPASFLEEDRYNAQLEGTFAALPSSGTIATLDDYFEIQSLIQFSYQPKSTVDEIRLMYQWHYTHFKSQESSYHSEQYIGIGLVKYFANKKTSNND